MVFGKERGALPLRIGDVGGRSTDVTAKGERWTRTSKKRHVDAMDTDDGTLRTGSLARSKVKAPRRTMTLYQGLGPDRN
jgi:hypothetical protein